MVAFFWAVPPFGAWKGTETFQVVGCMTDSAVERCYASGTVVVEVDIGLGHIVVADLGPHVVVTYE